MKVLHVLNSRVYSGAEKVASQIIRTFEEKDGMTLAYCSPESDMVARMLGEQNIRYLPVPSLTPGHLKKILQAEKPDLIHAHDMRATLVSAICCGKIPLISHIHNNAYDSRGLTVKSIGYLFGGCKAKKIIWVSKSAYEGYFFYKWFAGKSQVLYNILDTRQILDRKDQDPNVYDYDVIFVGRLTYPKNPQRLMQLCRLLADRKADVRVAIVGSGELEEESRQLCTRLGLEKNVFFLGFQPNPMKMIHDSKAMILTSRWEGTPMCALEAMALGTPVVSTPTDGLKDLVDNGINGYLADTDEMLAEKLLKIVEDPGHRAFLSENIRQKYARINDEAAYTQAISDCYR